MGCLKLKYYERETALSENWKIFARGIEKSASGVKNRKDYYAFGMVMPGRSFNSNSYRYGFNGMENDNEVKGNSNSVDFGARMYDPRLGRWSAVDAHAYKYAPLSPYSFVGNMPIIAIDPDGNEIAIVGNKEFHANFENMIIELVMHSDIFREMLKQAINSNSLLVITDLGADQGNRVDLKLSMSGSTDGSIKARLVWNFAVAGSSTSETDETEFTHELRHFLQYVAGEEFGTFEGETQTIDGAEVDAVFWENLVGSQMGEDLRETYDGVNVVDKTCCNNGLEDTPTTDYTHISNTELTREEAIMWLENNFIFEDSPQQTFGYRQSSIKVQPGETLGKGFSNKSSRKIKRKTPQMAKHVNPRFMHAQ